MESVPGILIVSSSNTKPKSIIKLIAGKTAAIDESIPDRVHYVWHVNTRYYTADVNIFGITENYERTDQFNSTIHAVVIHMDSNKKSGLQDLSKWENLFNDCNPEVKLLICNYITEKSEVPKTKALAWCIKRGFEFIELYPNNSESFNLDEEYIKEKVSIERLIEVLQTYVWPNLVMKNENNEPKDNSNIPDITKSDDFSLCNFIGAEDDDFTELFSQLQMMKESIKSLPINQRKHCAEQILTAFWNAVGGEDDELEDLDKAVE